MNHLPQEKLRDIASAAIEVGLDDGALRASLPPEIASKLPRTGSVGEQIFSDLQTLNRMELSDGTIALRTWLETAYWLARPRRQAAVFEDALTLVQRGSSAHPGFSAGGGQMTGPGSAAAGPRGGFSAPETPLVYILAADEDEALVTLLRKHLTPLRGSHIDLYSKRADAVAGDDADAWRLYMRRARIVLALVSVDLFASRRVSEELSMALDRHRQGQIRLLPVLARPASIGVSPLGNLEFLPKSGVALSVERKREEAMVEIVTAVRDTAATMAPNVPAQRPAAASSAYEPAQHWVHWPVYPFHLREARALCDVLMEAYPAVHLAEHAARRVPVRLNTWQNGHGIGPAWESLLALASAQSKLRELLDTVLADPLVAGFHDRIRSLLES